MRCVMDMRVNANLKGSDSRGPTVCFLRVEILINALLKNVCLKAGLLFCAFQTTKPNYYFSNY